MSSVNDEPLPKSSDPREAEQTTLIPVASQLARPDLIGPFKVIKTIGRGGMGEVFLCQDTRDPKAPQVALKTIFPELCASTEAVRRFDDEARAMRLIRHESVVRFGESGLFGEPGRVAPYMAMEYIQGTSLHLLSRQRRISFPDVISIASQIAGGLDAVHSQGIVHRDLKPANIMITAEGVAKIIDFGISKTGVNGSMLSENPESGFKTETGIVVGTVSYVAPEIFRGQNASVASDIYALGLILWEMLNAVTPFKSNDLAETMRNATTVRLPWSKTLQRLSPPGFIELVNAMTAKDPLERPANAKIIADELARIWHAAKWPPLLNRRSRFDLQIQWAPKTVQTIQSAMVDETAVGFVLQNIEDLMAATSDPCIKNRQPIEASISLIQRCINNFRAAQFEAGKTRKFQVAPAGEAPGYGQFNDIRMVENTRNSKLLKVGIALGAVLGLFFLFKFLEKRPDFGKLLVRAKTLAASTAKPLRGLTSVSPPQRVDSLFLNKKLVYRVTTPSENGRFVISEETRVLQSFTEIDATWLVDGVDTVYTPRKFLSAEAFFDPIYRKPPAPTTILSLTPLTLPLGVGSSQSYELLNSLSQSQEKSTCTIAESSQRTIAGFGDLNLWKIDCRRTLNSPAKPTRRISETILYSPSLDLVFDIGRRTEVLAADGQIAESFRQESVLQPNLSLLSRPGEAK